MLGTDAGSIGLAAAQKTFPSCRAPPLPTPLLARLALAPPTYLHRVVVLVAVKPTAGDAKLARYVLY